MFKKRARNTDTIVRDLNNMVEELLENKADQIAEANRQIDIINLATENKVVALQEADRASHVAEKIAQLIA